MILVSSSKKNMAAKYEDGGNKLVHWFQQKQTWKQKSGVEEKCLYEMIPKECNQFSRSYNRLFKKLQPCGRIHPGVVGATRRLRFPPAVSGAVPMARSTTSPRSCRAAPAPAATPAPALTAGSAARSWIEEENDSELFLSSVI